MEELEENRGKKFKGIFHKHATEEDKETILNMSKFCTGPSQRFLDSDITSAAKYVKTKVRMVPLHRGTGTLA